MLLSRGRIHRAIPGPSIIPDRVLQSMNKQAPNIYETEVAEITESILKDLSHFAKTSGETVIYISNGHGAWEASIANLFNQQDIILVIATGEFGKGWASLAKKMGLEVILLDFGPEGVINFNKLESILRSDKNYKIKGLVTVHADTASSVLNNLKTIRGVIDSCNHPALFLVDCIASFACDRLEMDDWGIDLVVTASQKGLMTPPGLSYCLVGQKSYRKSMESKLVSPYWDWKPRINPKVFYERFYGTAPTHLLFAQRVALDMILEEGRENIFIRHTIFANAVWDAITQWAKEGPIVPNIKSSQSRSTAVTTVRADGYDLTKFRNWVKNNAGLELGLGIGFDSSKYMNGASIFRIAHMGHMNPHMLLGLISTIEMGLLACNIPHNPGGSNVAAKRIIDYLSGITATSNH